MTKEERDSMTMLGTLVAALVLLALAACGCTPLEGLKNLAQVEHARAVQQQERARAIGETASAVYVNVMGIPDLPPEVPEKLKAIADTANVVGEEATRSEAWHQTMAVAVGPAPVEIKPGTEEEIAARSDFQRRSEAAAAVRTWGSIAVGIATGRKISTPGSISSVGSGLNAGLLGLLGGPAGAVTLAAYAKSRRKKDEEQDERIKKLEGAKKESPST